MAGGPRQVLRRHPHRRLLRTLPVLPGARTPRQAQLAAFRARIQHIVFLIKENRSFDMYFGTFPGADGATTATISTGERLTLRHGLDRMSRDVGHDWEDARVADDPHSLGSCRRHWG